MPDAGRTLLIGAGGMLGRAWRELLVSRGIDHDAPTPEDFDLTNARSMSPVADGAYSVVINCAAWTDVDGAEEHEDEATRVNGAGVGDLADACARSGALLIHYSTDYVFDGGANEPYPTDHPRDPINAYGRSKAAGERLIEDSGCAHITIRTSWLYAPWGNNFVRTMARLTGEHDSLRVVDDQRGRPTSAEHLASVSLGLIDAGARGIFHVTDGGECTWHGFTTEIAEVLGNECLIEPCTSDEFPRPAKRPVYSVLDLSDAEAIVGDLPDWQDNLRDTLSRLE